ncbi:hypothetical protein MPER_12701 [Moniliophthora perniciosa FA553]|nr:hypothetical protein MPER_12701 [Moniliophthora perniciosa FA553]
MFHEVCEGKTVPFGIKLPCEDCKVNLSLLGNRSRSSWQNIFLVEGIITTVIGLVLIPIFPTDPERTRILNEEERGLAIARMYADQPQVTIKNTKESINRSLVKRGILDVTTLACVWPSILKLNYPEASIVRIQLLVVPIYATATIVALLFTVGCIKLRMHWPFSVGGGLMTIVGWWAASNASPDTIRAMVGAVLYDGLLGSIAGIWYLAALILMACLLTRLDQRAYVQTDAPTGYHKGNSFNLAIVSSLCVGVIGLLLYQRRENRKRDLGARDYRLQEGNVEQ